MDKTTYQEDLEVSKYELDTLWEKQASLHAKWSFEEVELQKELDAQKRIVELIEAKLDLDIRKFPSKYGFESKPNESAIKSAIILDKKLLKEKEKLNEIEYAIKLVNNALRALEHKKRALTKLSDLYISGYWAEPKVSNEIKDKGKVYGKQKTSESLKKTIKKRKIKKGENK